MEATPRTIVIYETLDGSQPFSEWFESLKDKRTRTLILRRLERVKQGNLGDFKSVGNGICELKIDFGAGYRIYFGQIGNTIIILLCGGDKSTQEQDIGIAQAFWKDYRRQ